MVMARMKKMIPIARAGFVWPAGKGSEAPLARVATPVMKYAGVRRIQSFATVRAVVFRFMAATGARDFHRIVAPKAPSKIIWSEAMAFTFSCWGGRGDRTLVLTQLLKMYCWED